MIGRINSSLICENLKIIGNHNGRHKEISSSKRRYFPRRIIRQTWKNRGRNCAHRGDARKADEDLRAGPQAVKFFKLFLAALEGCRIQEGKSNEIPSIP